MKFNRVYLQVDGFNQLRLLNELKNNKIEIFGLERETSAIMRFEMREKDASKTFAILKKLCYNYKVIARSGLKSKGQTLLNRIGLVAAAVLLSIAMYITVGRVWSVDVYGTENVDALIIERQAAAAGVKVGSKVKNVDTKALRNAVNKIDGIIESSIEINGSNVIITVIEDTLYKPPKEKSTEPILADYDCEITRIILNSGTALIKRGDRVFKGTTLIAPYRVDAEGNQIEENASGEVYGKVTFTASHYFALKETTLDRTGKKKRVTDLFLFGAAIKGKTNHGYELFESEQTEGYVYDRMFIPIKIMQTTFYELKEVITEYDLSEREEHFKAQTLSDAAIKAGSGKIEIKSSTVKITDERYRIDVFVLAEMLIAEG